MLNIRYWHSDRVKCMNKVKRITSSMRQSICVVNITANKSLANRICRQQSVVINITLRLMQKT